MEYTLIYSDRRTLSATIKNGALIVRAPYKTPIFIVENFLEKHKRWIDKNLSSYRDALIFNDLSEEKIKELRAEAKEYFALKLQYYSEIMELKYSRMTITSAKTRFGSCSSKGNICFSYRLMMYPEAAREYVIVHELAHLKEMNHSNRFYSIIEKILPDYKERRRMLL